jgi:hypothetical protein
MRFLPLLFAVWISIIGFQCGRRKDPITHQSALTVGASSAPINPPLGAFIAGDRQNRTFTGIHDSLFVKAVVVDDGNSSIAIVTVDCIGLLYPDVIKIKKRAETRTSLSGDRIVVSSTHTHSGPDVVGIWGRDYEHSGVDSIYMNRLIETAAEQIRIAEMNKQPAIVVAGETQFGEPWVQNICKEEIDRSVTVMQFLSQNGESIATLTNFACHPTFLDSKFSEVSSDYVGGFYKKMKASFGGENLFLQGAIGGWVQPEDGEGTFEKAERRGRELGNAVQDALQKHDTLNEFSIRFKSKQVKFLVENESWKQLSAIGTIPRDIQDSVATELVWFAIGAAQFATHPGETAPYFGLETKKLMRTGPKFVMGLSMDALGYILKPVYFEDASKPHAGYLTSMSVGKQTGPQVMKTMAELMKDVQ